MVIGYGVHFVWLMGVWYGSTFITSFRHGR